MAAPADSSAATVRQRAIPLAIVLLSGLALRVGLLLAAWHGAADLHTLHTDDTPTYLAPAESLLARGTFFGGAVPEIFRTPGYPLLLTVGLMAGHVELFTVAVQMVLSLASIALVYHLAWKLTANAAVALTASVLAALEPLSIIFTSHLMPETMFTFLLLASVSLLLHYVRSSSAGTLFVAALLMAAASFVRPISYYLPLLFTALLVLRASIGQSAIASAEGAIAGRRSRALCCLAAVGFGIVALAPCAAWQVRNYLTTGYTGFSGIGECNLYYYQGASILAHESGKTLHQVQLEIEQKDARIIALLHGPEQATAVRLMGAEGRRLVAEHPVEYAKIHARGTAILALDPGGADLLHILGCYPEGVHGLRPLHGGIGETLARMHREVPQVLYLNLAFGVVLALVYCASALGLLATWHRPNWQWTLVLAMLAYFLAVSGGPTGCARLRQPMMPVVCILAGYGAVMLLSHLRARESARLPAAETRLTQAA